MNESEKIRLINERQKYRNGMSEVSKQITKNQSERQDFKDSLTACEKLSSELERLQADIRNVTRYDFVKTGFDGFDMWVTDAINSIAGNGHCLHAYVGGGADIIYLRR